MTNVLRFGRKDGSKPAGPAPAPGYDAATIAACRRGDADALERVLIAESPSLERLLGKIVTSRADQRDLLHETFVAAIEAFPRFQGHASVHTWLVGLAVRTAYDHIRRPYRRARATLKLIASDGDVVEVDHEARLDEARAAERLRHHLDALPAKQRIAFVLHVLEGHSMNEVAALMDATLTATKSRVWFGRRAFLKRAQNDPLLRELASNRNGGET